MKHDYLTLIATRPERIKIEGDIEYVQTHTSPTSQLSA